MNAIEITNLTKTYANNVQALKGINLCVAEGDFFALLGPNGAGKSTTIGIITSVVNKTSGQIKVFGHDLMAEQQIAKASIGVVPQEINFYLFETVLNTLLYQAGYYGVPRKIAKQRAEIYLREMDLWEKRHQPCLTLSGGMKRRLMIARALMHHPNLLMLDEPTAGVDIEIRRHLWHFLRRLNEQGTTIILTTHYLEEAENLCKNIAIIDKGTIVENTSIKQVLTKLHVETFIFNLQQPLLTLPMLGEFAARLIDETTLEIDIQQKQSLNELFQLLTQQNIQISSMRNKVNRLEELFLRLTKNEKL